MVRVDHESASFFGGMRVTSIERGSVSGFGYVVAECEPRGGRRHRRVLVDEPSQPTLNNRPLFYLDTYTARSEEKTYAYARHLADTSTFFTTLSTILEVERLRESKASEYRAVFNFDGEISERHVTFPFLKESIATSGLKFCRFFFPFGDVASEFGEQFLSNEAELADVRRYRQLTKKLESPLVGCDLSHESAIGKLLVKIHWLSRQVPASVLWTMLEEVTRTPVTA